MHACKKYHQKKQHRIAAKRAHLHSGGMLRRAHHLRYTTAGRANTAAKNSLLQLSFSMHCVRSSAC